MNEPDSKWVQNIKETLDQNVEGMDAGTLSRLNQARQQALDSRKRRGFAWQDLIMQPALGWTTAIAATLLLVFAVGDFSNTRSDTSLDDLEILASADQLDLYEDLEFYTWLAQQGNRGHHAG